MVVPLHSAAYADTANYTMPLSKAGVFESATTDWIPTLASCPPTEQDCPAPMIRKLTGNLLRVFGQGPVGVHYPSVANWQQFYP
jgi:hypothetical protein